METRISLDITETIKAVISENNIQMPKKVKISGKNSINSSGCEGSDLILVKFSTISIKGNEILIHKYLQQFLQIFVMTGYCHGGDRGALKYRF